MESPQITQVATWGENKSVGEVCGDNHKGQIVATDSVMNDIVS